MKLNQKVKRYLGYAKYALLALAYLFLMEVLGWIFSSQGTWSFGNRVTMFAAVFYFVWTALFAALAISLSLVLYRTKGKGIVPALHFLNGAAVSYTHLPCSSGYGQEADGQGAL